MPSKSDSQRKLMNIVAHDKEFAKKVGIPQKVGKEFHEADKKLDQQKKPTTQRVLTKK